MFNLSQDISWSYNFNTGSEKVQMSKGEVCVFRNNNYSTEMNYEAGANFVFKNLQMPTTYFQELLSKYFTDQKIAKLKEHFLTHVTKTKITPEMYRVLSEIDTADRFSMPLPCTLMFRTNALNTLPTFYKKTICQFLKQPNFQVTPT